jgi:hypothetical protein
MYQPTHALDFTLFLSWRVASLNVNSQSQELLTVIRDDMDRDALEER